MTFFSSLGLFFFGSRRFSQKSIKMYGLSLTLVTSVKRNIKTLELKEHEEHRKWNPISYTMQ